MSSYTIDALNGTGQQEAVKGVYMNCHAAPSCRAAWRSCVGRAVDLLLAALHVMSHVIMNLEL